MTKPAERLRRRADFLRTAALGRKCAMPGLVLQAANRADAAVAARIGFTASRRVGGAVARNRARRRLRAAAAAILSKADTGAVDLVLIARPETLNRPFAALLADLETALRRTGIAGQADGRRRRV